MAFFSPTDKIQSAFSTASTTSSSASTTTTPTSNVSLFPMTNLFSPFGDSDIFDFSSYFDGSFESTMKLLLMSSKMNAVTKNALFSQNFNTNSNLPSLKQAKYSSDVGNKLANIAYKNATRTNTVGRCYHEVKDSLKIAGLNHGELTGGSAFQAADILGNHKNFREVTVQRNELKSLPAGCIIVWDQFNDRKGKFHKDGHIAITLGNGKEASDHVQNLLTTGDKYTVYAPTEGINKTT